MPSAETNRIISEIDSETTRVAGVVTQCQADIHTGMTSQEVADVNTRLTAVAQTLKGIGANPSEPVPDNPPA